MSSGPYHVLFSSLHPCCVTHPVWLGWLAWARGCRTDAGTQASLQWLWRGRSTSSSAARGSSYVPPLHTAGAMADPGETRVCAGGG
jgi:hypothetical protein